MVVLAVIYLGPLKIVINVKSSTILVSLCTGVPMHIIMAQMSEQNSQLVDTARQCAGELMTFAGERMTTSISLDMLNWLDSDWI